MRFRGRGLTGQDLETQVKQLQEEKRVKSVRCPYLETCEEKVLPEQGRAYCLDREEGISVGYLLHLKGLHCWEYCETYLKRAKEERGLLPRDLEKLQRKEKEILS